LYALNQYLSTRHKHISCWWSKGNIIASSSHKGSFTHFVLISDKEAVINSCCN